MIGVKLGLDPLLPVAGTELVDGDEQLSDE
jgi:hypothetical protein